MSAMTKRGYTMTFSEEMVAHMEGFEQEGHLEPVTPTAEQVAQHARAKKLVKEFKKNPYVQIIGHDWELCVEELEVERWVADESHQEWLARWRAARKGETE